MGVNVTLFLRTPGRKIKNTDKHVSENAKFSRLKMLNERKAFKIAAGHTIA